MARANHFISGRWAPAAKEETHESAALPVRGQLPADLDGVFLRIGPNPARPEKIDPRSYHFFGGDGMVHRFEIRGGEARYRSRWVRTDLYVNGKERTYPNGGRGGVANTAMVYHAGRLLCLSEGNRPWEMSLPSLDTVGRFDYGGALRHNFTAHPKVCPETGELVFFGYGGHSIPGADPQAVCHSVVSPAGKLLRTVPIRFRRNGMLSHDVAITRQYSVLLDLPLWSLTKPVRAEDRSRFGVLPRHAASSADVRWFDAPGVYGYHVANAWEEGGRVELAIVAAEGFHFQRSNAAGLLMRRYSFDLASGETAADRVLCDVPMEFPVVNPGYVGRRSRWAWAARLAQKVAEPLPSSAVLKVDLGTGACVQRDYPDGWRGGEPRFVPRRGAAAEDDGYVLVLLHGPGGAGELAVYDAATLAPVAAVAAPVRIPNGFHALWVDTAEYAAPAARL